jgi:hypothetical protein
MMKSVREIMQEMTEDQKANAHHAHRAICEGVPAMLTHAEAKELEALGLLEDVSEPETGKKMRGHFTFAFSDRLEDFVTIRVLQQKVQQLEARDRNRCEALAARKASLKVPCDHLPELVIDTETGERICCHCWADGLQIALQDVITTFKKSNKVTVGEEQFEAWEAALK